MLIISTFTSRILSFIHVAMNDEAKAHGDLTLCCVLTFWNRSNEYQLSNFFFTSIIAHIDYLEVKKKSISSDIRLCAFVLLAAETEAIYADLRYSVRRREGNNSTKLSDEANDNDFSSHS